MILDGPAVLGLADCRMLGRVVDAAVLVVRSGVARAAAAAAGQGDARAVARGRSPGVVFNGLSEDLQNWSSYGHDGLLTASPDGRPGLGAASAGLGARASTARRQLTTAGPVGP